MNQLRVSGNIQIRDHRIAQHNHISSDKTDKRQFTPFLIECQSEHPHIQNGHIRKQHQIIPHPVTYQERSDKTTYQGDNRQLTPVIENGKKRHKDRQHHQYDKGCRLTEQPIIMIGHPNRHIENGKCTTRQQRAERPVCLFKSLR